MIKQVQQCCRESTKRDQGDSKHHITDLGNARIGKQFLYIILVDCNYRTNQNSKNPEGKESLVEGEEIETVISTNNREQEPEQEVDGDFGGRCSKKDRDCRGGPGIGIGQPEVEREDGGLNGQADQKKANSSMKCPALGVLLSRMARSAMLRVPVML